MRDGDIRRKIAIGFVSNLYLWQGKFLLAVIERKGIKSLVLLDENGRESWNYLLGSALLLGESWNGEKGDIQLVIGGGGDKFTVLSLSVKEKRLLWKSDLFEDYKEIITTENKVLILYTIKFKEYRLDLLSRENGTLDWSGRFYSRRIVGIRSGRGDLFFTFGAVLDKLAAL